MSFVDERFKEVSPVETVRRIKKILGDLGIETTEKQMVSGIENCCSVRVTYKGSDIGTNGKGVTPEFALASGYAEFMERLQQGIFRISELSRHTEIGTSIHLFAPDKKYMTEAELVENGEWMDQLIKASGGKLTRKKIASLCALYDGKKEILTIPFYSLFEKKYVYLPAQFVRCKYGANGCCAGNSRNEAWAHALSEILERNNAVKVISSGSPAPEIPREALKKFDTVNRILRTIDDDPDVDVELFDFSNGSGFPVVAARYISKKTNDYIVDVGADPVFEIAVERCLTELFQGKNLSDQTSWHGGRLLFDINETNLGENIVGQVCSRQGMFVYDFFLEEFSEKRFEGFPDNSEKSIDGLLSELLSVFKKSGLNVYVRNYSYLGFDSYKFVIPGFSENFGIYRMLEPVEPFWYTSRAADILKDVENASDTDLEDLMLYEDAARGNMFAESNGLSWASALQLHGYDSGLHDELPFVYACRRLGRTDEYAMHVDRLLRFVEDENARNYVKCLYKYDTLCSHGVEKEKTVALLYKFFRKDTVDKVLSDLKNGRPYTDLLFRCTRPDCDGCKFKKYCDFSEFTDLIKIAGEKYSRFTDGQRPEVFDISGLCAE